MTIDFEQYLEVAIFQGEENTYNGLGFKMNSVTVAKLFLDGYKDRHATEALTVNPTGAELANLVRAFATESQTTKSPDPDGKIQRGAARLIQSEVTLVPSRLRAGGSTQIHLALTPNGEVKAHWNNEFISKLSNKNEHATFSEIGDVR